jgi:two-component system sensor histidine kinase/response regulator
VTPPLLGRLLVVDDETAQMCALRDTLGFEGYDVRGFDSPTRALAEFRAGDFDLIITDLMMPEIDGIGLISSARAIDPQVGAIVMTGHGTIDTAVLAMQGGALDYILKPFRLNVILPVISRALDLQRLRRENAELQERERRRSEDLAVAYRDLESFSYSISHDLRTPLRAVDGFAEILEDSFAEALGQEGTRLIRIIRDGSRRMDEMIVGLLSFAQASRQPIQSVAIDMSALVRAAIADALAAYSGPKASIVVGSLPPAAGDAIVLRQVWANLIGNALKYSAKRATPTIHINGSIQDAEAVYSVQDNGAGFDMRHVDKLFGVFQRLHKVDEFAGTGVGLAIVHRIIARHGGRVWAQGATDAGACIWFALPLAEPASSVHAQPAVS